MPVERIRAFRHALQRASAERRVPSHLGEGLFADSIPDVYDHNYLSIEDGEAAPEEIAAETEVLMERHFHRRVVLERGSDALSAAMLPLGYIPSRHLVLAHVRRPDRLVDTSMVREVPFDEIVPARTKEIMSAHWGDEQIARQLNRAKELIFEAIPTRFFAAHIDGEVAAFCELRSDGHTAQIEDVEVAPRYRGRGLGRAIVQHALLVAEGGHDIVFLEALADDWPRQLYVKLGFDVVDRRDFLTRLPHPLTRLRLRTPRLELRLPTVAELRQLFDVAAAGVHDPAFMPFGTAWTDDLDEDGFVYYHRTRLTGATATEWELALVAFFDGKPVGVQSIQGHDFATTHVVGTGSWLGSPWQGIGLGTEMRNAVLTFAFGKLGAVRATSGAIEGNHASVAVSRKLGYSHVGSSTVAPRGEPVEHANFELAREDFRRTVPVEIVAFDPATLSWFGVSG